MARTAPIESPPTTMRVAVRAKPLVLFLHGRVPVRPAGGPEVVGGAAMSRELRHVHGVAGAGEALRDVAHLDWRAAEPVDEQEADASSRQTNALIHDVHSSSLVAAEPAVRFPGRHLRTREYAGGGLAGARSAAASHAARCAVTSWKSVKVACCLPAAAAIVGERALGDDVVGARRHAEVGAPVADHHARPGAAARRASTCSWRLPTRQSARPCGNARRQRSPPCHSSRLAKNGMRKPCALQGGAHDAIEAVGDDLHVRAPAPAELRKAAKAGIDADAANFLVELLRRDAQQLHLTLHAFARGDLPGLPRRLDHAPQRVGEALEQPVRGIVGSDGPVEIDENLPPRARRK